MQDEGNVAIRRAAALRGRAGTSGQSMLAALLASCMASAGLAQEGTASPVDPDGVAVHEQVVVTAARVEQRADEVPVTVTLLDSDRLERTAALTLDDALRQVPGFSLFRRSSSLVAHPTTQGVSLRGIGPSGVSRTLVLLDGLPVNDPFGGWVYWSRVPRHFLERVEIVHGGGSSVWGNYALGGVIQLLTGRPERSFVRGVGELGENETYGLDLAAGKQFSGADLSLGGAWLDTGGYPVVREDQRGAIDVPATSQHLDLYAGLRFDLGDASELSVRGDVFDEERGNGTPLTGNDTEAVNLSLHGSRVGAAGSSGTTEIAYALFYGNQDFASLFSAQAEDRSSERPALDQFLVDSEFAGLNLQWSRGLGEGSHLVSAGTDLRWIDGTTNEDFRNLGAGFTRRRRAGGEQQLAGLFLQDNLDLGTRVRLHLGARVDVWRGRRGFRFEESLEDGSVVRNDRFEDREETELSPRLALLYEAADGLELKGSIYRSFRAPTVNELYRPFRVRNDITEANEGLVPETLVGADLGLVYRPTSGSFRLAGFWNEVEDPVANVTLALGPGVIAPCGFVPGGGSCRQRQNLGETRIRGLEAEAELRPSGAGWSLGLSYLYSDARVVSSETAPELEGKRLAQVPENQLVGRFEIGSGPVLGSLQVRWIDEQFEDDLNERPLDPFTVLDLYLSWELSERVRLFAALENALDEEVEVGKTADGLVAVGTPRLLHGGVRFRFD